MADRFEPTKLILLRVEDAHGYFRIRILLEWLFRYNDIYGGGLSRRACEHYLPGELVSVHASSTLANI